MATVINYEELVALRKAVWFGGLPTMNLPSDALIAIIDDLLEMRVQLKAAHAIIADKAVEAGAGLVELRVTTAPFDHAVSEWNPRAEWSAEVGGDGAVPPRLLLAFERSELLRFVAIEPAEDPNERCLDCGAQGPHGCQGRPE